MAKIYTTHKIMEILNDRRTVYLCNFIVNKDKLRKDDYGGIHDHYLPMAEQYFLLGSRNRITEILKVETESGCGASVKIDATQLAKTLEYSIKNDLKILGFARIGCFDIHNRWNVHQEYLHFMAENKYVELVLGRNGTLHIKHRMNKGGWGSEEDEIQLIEKG